MLAGLPVSDLEPVGYLCNDTPCNNAGNRGTVPTLERALLRGSPRIRQRTARFQMAGITWVLDAMIDGASCAPAQLGPAKAPIVRVVA